MGAWLRGVDERRETGPARAGARRGIGGGAPPGPGAGEEDRSGPDAAGMGGKLLRRSAMVVGIGVEGRESGSGIEGGVPERRMSTGGYRGALGGRTGGLGFSTTGSGNGSAGCG